MSDDELKAMSAAEQIATLRRLRQAAAAWLAGVTARLDHLAKLLHMARDKEFEVVTGKDTTAYPMMAFGGSGMFSVAANVIPKVMSQIAELCLVGRLREARELHYKYYDLLAALRLETNPMAAKAALSVLGLPGSFVRPPLTDLSETNRGYLASLLKDAGLF